MSDFPLINGLPSLQAVNPLTVANLIATGNVTAPDYILGTSGPSVKSSLSARAPRQGLVLDGTAGATFSGVPAFGTNPFSYVVFIRPNQMPSVASAIIRGAANSADLGYLTNGTIQLNKADVSNTLSTPSGQISAGKTACIVYTRGSGTGTFYVNGVSVASGSDSVDYSAATTVIGGTAPTYIHNGFIYALIYNRALSATEIVSLYESSAPSGVDYNAASNTSKLTGANSDFSSAGNWTVAGATTISGGKLNLSNGDQAFCFPGNISIPIGAKFRVTLTVDSITAGSVQVYTGGVGLWVNIATTAGTFTQDFTFLASSGSLTTLNLRSTGGNAVVDTVLFYQIGLLLAPDAQENGGGYLWNDQSGNLAQIVLPASGVAWNLRSVSTQRIRGTTSTNGNQQLLGASVLLPAESQILRVRARSRTGTPTITIGTASGGAQIVASVALSTTWQNLTIALTGGIVSAADDIWINSNSTDTVETDIEWQPLDF